MREPIALNAAGVVAMLFPEPPKPPDDRVEILGSDGQPIRPRRGGSDVPSAISLRTWRVLDAGGKCPRGFFVGGRKLWRVADLHAWAAAGFPNRSEFERLTATPTATPAPTARKSKRRNGSLRLAADRASARGV